ncbi:LysE family transporter [Aquincola sp. S2]|uniref:LysE family transporter n=1 Tax=Pseudaquabacterium terrae TaxID=2732868 RepID=A0ABX2EAB8_9BURK|nr:LysE family transporter [Aquabacterium terrae]NRF66004.1 LysE family transporter [Aquabacterium terrae]
MTTDPMLLLFAQSLLIGLSIAAPVGPIGLLTIQRTLASGPAAGLATGLGAAVADAVYGAIGAFGVSAVIAWLTGARTWFAVGGGAFLLWLAWSIWRTPIAERAADAGSGRDLLRCFAGTFVLTLSNPATILSFIAVFGALAGRLAIASPWPMIAGVLIGSALWWLFLAAAVGRLRERFDRRWRRRINQGSALLLAAFALWQWGALLLGEQ